MTSKHYVLLLVMGVLHFAAMFALMYAMVDTASDIFTNFNQAYMAGLMTAPMLIMEVVLMGAMYPNKHWNASIAAAGAFMLVVLFICIRQQTWIGDRQFLRSMIPHHSGAILMCERASIADPEIKELCKTIVLGQQSEIDQMKAILNRLGQ
jgi:hypothetical protein